jgi:hypothetical protein
MQKIPAAGANVSASTGHADQTAEQSGGPEGMFPPKGVATPLTPVQASS